MREDRRDIREDRGELQGEVIDETYATEWLAAKATAVRYLWAREADNNFGCCRFVYREIFCPTGISCHIRPSSSSITSAQVETGGRELTATVRFVATSCNLP